MERYQDVEIQSLFESLAEELKLPELLANPEGQVALYSEHHHLTAVISACFREQHYDVQLEAEVASESSLELPQVNKLLSHVQQRVACGLVLDNKHFYAVRQKLCLKRADPVGHLIDALKSFIDDILQLRQSLSLSDVSEEHWSSDHLWV